jgi:hypothetical protein
VAKLTPSLRAIQELVENLTPNRGHCANTGFAQGVTFVSPTSRAFRFISGLPRAGSTLTAAILRQNPPEAGV